MWAHLVADLFTNRALPGLNSEDLISPRDVLSMLISHLHRNLGHINLLHLERAPPGPVITGARIYRNVNIHIDTLHPSNHKALLFRGGYRQYVGAYAYEPVRRP